MKVLHYSDKGVKNFEDLYEKCDVLVATGDLTLFDFGKLQEKQNRKPAFGVYGNHCSGTYFEPLGIENLHNKVIDFNGYKWGGFQGCLKYKETGIMFTEEEAAVFANDFPYVDILLLHSGPRGLLDDPSDPVHIGSESVRKYVTEKNPKLVFLGHQYTNEDMEFGVTELHRTYGARIIDI
jgi:uncharacterized protein